MGLKLHLIPAALRRKCELWQVMKDSYDKALAEAEANPGTKKPKPVAPLVLTPADWGNMSGRVVELRSLNLHECTLAEDAVIAAAGPEEVPFAQFAARRADARARKAIVAVSDPFVPPDRATTAPMHRVTELLLEGAGGPSDGRGGTKPSGFAWGDLFGQKDVVVLREWDKKQHAVTQDDVDSILGNAIPTTE